VAVIMLREAWLAYVGFSGTTLSWGYEIERGQDLLRTRPWIAIFPGIGIVLTVIAVNLIGDWLRDALDPNVEGSERGA
jgi:peptide/nickel transport system permease protein